MLTLALERVCERLDPNEYAKIEKPLNAARAEQVFRAGAPPQEVFALNDPERTAEVIDEDGTVRVIDWNEPLPPEYDLSSISLLNLQRANKLGRNEFIYYPGMIRIPEGSAPDFKNRSWTVAAEIAVPDGGASGVIATIGGRFGAIIT